MITEEDAREYAEYLIRNHAMDIEFLTVHEMAEDYFVDELDGEDVDAIYTALHTAILEVSWNDG